MYGTHLDAFDASEKKRNREMKQLLVSAEKDIKDGKQVIIAGDMNAADQKDYADTYNSKGQSVWELVSQSFYEHSHYYPASLVTNTVHEAGFTDCFALSKSPEPHWTTWTGTRIDRIYLSPNWTYKITGCYTYMSGASDHLPILMDFQIPK